MTHTTDAATMASTAAHSLIEAVESVLSTLKGESDAPDLETLLTDLALYAWSGVTHHYPSWIDERLQEAAVPVELLRGQLTNTAGDTLVSDDVIGFVNRLVNAAHARKAIDDGGQVTIEWLAALANVSERTIRSATNASNPNAMPIIKDGHWTFIDAAPALQWLSRRKDFVPTQTADNRPRSVVLQWALRPGDAWQKWRQSRDLTIDDLAAALGWSIDEAALYTQIEAGNIDDRTLTLSPAFWRDLAVHLGSEEPEAVATTTYRTLASDYANWRLKNDLTPHS